MKYGLYIRNPLLYDDLQACIKEDIIDTIILGDYGCRFVLPECSEIIKINKYLTNKKLHYISPKLPNDYIDKEFERIQSLLNANISVSINDLGLLYKLNLVHKQLQKIYLGRHLSQSISYWAWHSINLKHENNNAQDFFLQNSFNHDEKIDFFKKYQILWN